MMIKQLFMVLSAGLAFAAVAQETPPAPPPKPDKQTEEKPAVNTSPKSSDRKTLDRMELDSTVITGNRELPKVLYIVPWKKSGMGDLPGRPANSLLDEVLAPVDREVFRRQTEYFTTLQSSGQSETTTPPATKD